MKRFIPVAAPALVGNEKAYVMDCLQSTWISSAGHYVPRFEAAFAEFCGVRQAVSCCTGTAALHLALLALGVGPGDEVIIPTLTYVAAANAVTYCGARPAFVDSDPRTWNLDPLLIEASITPQTKGIIVVHLYGHPVDMDPVLNVAGRHGLFVVEDAAQAHGAEYKGRRVGSLGDIGTFSFYGNKILTTGQGGMAVTNDGRMAESLRQLRNQGRAAGHAYWYTVVGYNYQLTNIAAAIGLAQLERAEWHLERRREVAQQYARGLATVHGVALQAQEVSANSAHWMTGMVLGDDVAISSGALMKSLAEKGIETRPFFHPMHRLPMYADAASGHQYPVAEHLASRGICLPTSATLTEEDVAFVCRQVIWSLAAACQ